MCEACRGGRELMGCDFYATEDGEIEVEVRISRKLKKGWKPLQPECLNIPVEKGDAIWIETSGNIRER